jgi:hypothetical protein
MMFAPAAAHWVAAFALKWPVTLGFATGESALRETVERGLVASGRRNVGAGPVKGLVNGHDLLRGVHQQSGRPQVVRQVVATCFQLSGQTAIENQDGIVGNGECHDATLLSAQLNASVRLRRRHAKNTARRSGATEAVSGDMFTITHEDH